MTTKTCFTLSIPTPRAGLHSPSFVVMIISWSYCI